MRWSAYLLIVAAAQEEGMRRRERTGAQTLALPIEAYPYLSQYSEAMSKPRQRVFAYEQCRAELTTMLFKVRGMRLSFDQIRLFDVLRDTMLLQMYNRDINALTADMHWLKREYHVGGGMETVAFVMLARRSGKTLTQTMNAAVVMLTQDRGNVFAVNPNKEQARSWMSQLYGHLQLLKDHDIFGWTEETYRENTELVIIPRRTGRRVTCISRGNASSDHAADGLRGGGTDLFLLNMDEYMFYADGALMVVLPMTANGSAIVGTSSMPNKDSNAYLMSFAEYRKNLPIANVVSWSNMCDMCQRRQERTRRDVNCRHTQATSAPFRSHFDDLRTKALMAPFGGYAREMQNAAPLAPRERVFARAYVEALFGLDAPTVTWMRCERNEFYIGIDPGSTMTRSDTAIVSFCYVSACSGGVNLREPGPLPTCAYDHHVVVRLFSYCYILSSSSSSTSS